MAINPLTGLEEDDDVLQVVQPESPAPMNPTVKDYLLKRKAERDALTKEEGGYDTTGAITGALAALGAGFQGKDSVGAGMNILNQRQDNRRKAVQDFDVTTDRGSKEIDLTNSSDAASPDSVAMQEQIGTLFPQLKGVVTGKSKAQISQMMPLLSAKIRGDTERDNARAAREDRNFYRDQALKEKEQGLQTPFGTANTVDDAKQLKEAFESKKNFDNKIQEMIALRQKHGGGAILNREDVGRGKQLSKDLLLEYKNMAKLGVLSAADEAIINEIIPADPLEYNSPLAALQGQDPILHKLKKFKNDSDKDFQTRVSTRTRGGGKVASSEDEKAIAWAMNNPQDPRAAKILKMHGKQVAGN